MNRNITMIIEKTSINNITKFEINSNIDNINKNIRIEKKKEDKKRLEKEDKKRLEKENIKVLSEKVKNESRIEAILDQILQKNNTNILDLINLI